MSEKASIPEVCPLIYFDIDHGEYVDWIDVDLAAVTKQLRDGGVPDEDIRKLKIHFKTTCLDKKRDVAGKYKQNGYYLPKLLRGPDGIEEQIKISRPSHLLKMQNGRFYETPTAVRRSIEASVERGYSATLAHELDHVVAARDANQLAQDRAYERTHAVYRNYLRISKTSEDICVGSLREKIRSRREGNYEKHPKEVRARAAGIAAPESLVMIRSKQR